jgi:TIR domain-containing protein
MPYPHNQRGCDVNNRIFISYRTCDDPFAALFIDKQLSEHFGSQQVFRDCRTIRPGTHFPSEISQALQQCRVLLAIIGPRWLRRRRDGRRLIDDPADYVRLEIAEGLHRGVLVVPVLVGKAALPTASALPAEIAGLATCQYLPLRVRDADYDVLRLVDELMGLLGEAGS